MLQRRKAVSVEYFPSWLLEFMSLGIHLFATAESWSRILPRPSNIVSSVSLLSSTVSAETTGLFPHKAASS